MDSSWLLWQLADSGLPTGGFVASSGLEAALATGLVAGSPDGVRLFVRESVKSYAMSAGPFVAAAHRLCRKANEDCDGRDRTLQAALDLDDEYDTSTGNAVARRASAAQGGALLSLWSKSFKMDDKDCGRSEVIGEENPGIERTRRLNVLIQDFKAECRKGTVVGHVPVCFGLLCGYLDLSLEQTQTMFLFLYARSIINAAVRLNALGPYLAQRLLSESREDTLKAWEASKDLTTAEARQTAPLMDLAQGLHGRLYSRLFSS